MPREPHIRHSSTSPGYEHLLDGHWQPLEDDRTEEERQRDWDAAVDADLERTYDDHGRKRQ